MDEHTDRPVDADDPYERIVERERRRHRHRRNARSRAVLRVHTVVYLAVHAAFAVGWLVATALFDAGERGARDGGGAWIVVSVASWGAALAVHAIAVHRRRRHRQVPATR